MKKANFKKKIIAIVLIWSIFATPIYGYAIGDELPSPQNGWIRNSVIDKSKFVRSKNIKQIDLLGNKTGLYTSQQNEYIKFKFTGDKLRIISNTSSDRADDVKLTLDGTTYNLSNHYSDDSKDDAIIFEKNDLNNHTHEVTITSGIHSKFSLLITYIDISKNGKILTYNNILDVTPQKNTINLNETFTADLEIDNITNIAAEDIFIDYDESKLEFVGVEETSGIIAIHSNNDSTEGQLRLILASQGESNIVNDKKILLKLNFKGIHDGDALIDITKARVTDGITMEKNLSSENCGHATVTIVRPKDVNRTGEFTLLDLGIDARHYGKDPQSAELSAYDTDVVINNAIDKNDLLKIGQEMLANSEYVVAVD